MMIRLLSLAAAIALSACAPSQQHTLPFPEPLRHSDSVVTEPTPVPPVPQEKDNKPARSLQISIPPSPPGKADFIIDAERETLPTFTASAPVQISLDNVPLPAFINEVFGNLLGLSFQLEPALQNKTDLVSVRITEPMSAPDLYRTASKILETYGIAVIPQGQLLRFGVLGRGQSSNDPPLLVSGRTLPEVPDSHRTVFQVVPLIALHQVQVMSLLRQVYKFPELTIAEDALNNALLISGPPAQVAQAVQAIRVLDRPAMQGRQSIRLQPAFLAADKLAEQLLNILKVEGYHAVLGVGGANPPITLLPVREINSVFVFARESQILAHIREWAENLDRPGHLTTDRRGLFFYPVQNTLARRIIDTLTPLMRPQASGAIEANLVIDEARNMLLYQGSSNEWARMLPIIQALDKPARLILVEVTIAEVLLNNEEQFGVEWLLRNSTGSSHQSTLSTLGGIGLGSAGLSYSLLNGLGQTRAMLNAFASNNRINILSTPRIMLKSGENASINVGTDVPIVTSQSVATDGAQSEGNSAIMQNIQYRKTGVSLDVKAVAYSGNQVDLQISQEVSQAQPNNTSNISSPLILNRNIKTSISLNDGGSVLLGGLISDTRSQGSSGVPGLSRIPLLGHLFRVDKKAFDRSELIILIVPYVLSTNNEAQEISNVFRQRLDWDMPTVLEE
jgi:general secretion pathway protein D